MIVKTKHSISIVNNFELKYKNILLSFCKLCRLVLTVKTKSLINTLTNISLHSSYFYEYSKITLLLKEYQYAMGCNQFDFID